MEVIRVRHKVRRKSARSKYFVVVKCLVTASSQEEGGHYSEIEIVSQPVDHDRAYQLRDQFDEQEKKKETAESQS